MIKSPQPSGCHSAGDAGTHEWRRGSVCSPPALPRPAYDDPQPVHANICLRSVSKCEHLLTFGPAWRNSGGRPAGSGNARKVKSRTKDKKKKGKVRKGKGSHDMTANGKSGKGMSKGKKKVEKSQDETPTSSFFGAAYVETQNEQAPWYDQPEAALPKLRKPKTASGRKPFRLSAEAADRLVAKGREALQAEVDRFTESKLEIQDKSERKWFQTVMASGTLSDKVAALTLSIQESPFHSLPFVDRLVAMGNKKSASREREMATEALKDLFLQNLLPPNRKLQFFNDRASAFIGSSRRADKSVDPSSAQLAFWVFEHELKLRYSKFLSILRESLKDTLEHVRMRTVGALQELLSGVPEQEKTVLELIVNKLGDRVRKVASQAVHVLNKILDAHPGMKLVVIKEVERLIFRPNVSERAQYYGVICMNQIAFTRRTSCAEAAGHSIRVYLSLFKRLGGSAKVNAKIVSALLTGIKRAFPFVSEDASDALQEEASVLFRVAHTAPLAASIQALSVLFQIRDANSSMNRRYYRALYAKVVHPTLATSHKLLTLFLNLVYKALLADEDENRVRAFVKRLLQVCMASPVHFVCGVLYMLQHVAKQRPAIVAGIVKAKARKRGASGTDDAEPKLYDGFNRNPEFCDATGSGLWESVLLGAHFHPAVAKFVSEVAAGRMGKYKGDPLVDFTNIAFLDRFVYKNPKKPKPESDDRKSVFRKKKKRAAMPDRPAVNDESFVKLQEAQVPAHERFFHKFFRIRAGTYEEGENDDDDDSGDGKSAMDGAEAGDDSGEGDGDDNDDNDANESASELDSDEVDEFADYLMDRELVAKASSSGLGKSHLSREDLMDPDLDDDDDIDFGPYGSDLDEAGGNEVAQSGDEGSDRDDSNAEDSDSQSDAKAEQSGLSGSGGNGPVPDAHTLGDDESSSDDAEAEAAALREMMGGGDDDDEDDDDDDFFFDSEGDDDDDDDELGQGGSFAAVEEYRDLLDGDDMDNTEGRRRGKKRARGRANVDGGDGGGSRRKRKAKARKQKR